MAVDAGPSDPMGTGFGNVWSKPSCVSKKLTPPVYVVVVEVTGACWIRDKEAGVDRVVAVAGDAVVLFMVRQLR